MELLEPRLMRFFRACHKGKKAWTIVHRNFGEHFAIQIDARAFQSADKFAVGNIGAAACRIDAHNPQRAEIALLQSTPDEAVAQSLLDGFLRGSIQLGFGEKKPLGATQGLLAVIPPVGTSFYSR